MIMYKKINTLLLGLVGLLLLTISSCKSASTDEPDPIIDPVINNQARFVIDVDWTLMGEIPSGMTVLYYPEDGVDPYHYITNEVFHIDQTLQEKEYVVLIFNQSIEEFETIDFRNMGLLEEAEVYIPETTETSSRLERLFKGNGRGYSSTAKTRPKSFGAGKTSSKTATRGYIAKDTVQIIPKVGELSISIYVRGLDNAINANGALTALASGCYLGVDKLSSESLTQELENWTISSSANDSVGVLSTSIGTFGISPNLNTNAGAPTRSLENAGSYVEESEEDDYRNILYLNFLLKDYTYVSYRFDVTKYIKNYTTDLEIELELNLGSDLEEYLSLPESGFPYKTTPVTISPWGEDPVDHNISL